MAAAIVAAVLPDATAAAAPAPPIQAPAAIVIDASDGHVLYARGPDQRRAIASTTKLMTALLVLERARPGEVFTAPDYDAAPAESRIDLAAGERMTVSDLLEALLLESANDAAVTLADGVSGSTGRFVAAMNRRAQALGLADTRYANPIGLDDPDGYSTAGDLAVAGVPAHAQPPLRPHRGLAGGPARLGCPAACGGEPQSPDRRLPVRERGEDRAHAPRRLRAGGGGRHAQDRPGGERGARRAERGRPGCRHARAAPLGPHPLPARGAAPAGAAGGRRRDRAPRRARRARAAPARWRSR